MLSREELDELKKNLNEGWDDPSGEFVRMPTVWFNQVIEAIEQAGKIGPRYTQRIKSDSIEVEVGADTLAELQTLIEGKASGSVTLSEESFRHLPPETSKRYGYPGKIKMSEADFAALKIHVSEMPLPQGFVTKTGSRFAKLGEAVYADPNGKTAAIGCILPDGEQGFIDRSELLPGETFEMAIERIYGSGVTLAAAAPDNTPHPLLASPDEPTYAEQPPR